MKLWNCRFGGIKGGGRHIGARFMKLASANAGTARRSECSREQEMSMRKIRTRTIAGAVAMAAVLSPAPMRAQTTQAALSKEAGTLSDKFAGLARVMAGKYNWKPAEGVRSVGDV